jgi:hypothetical protein
MGYNIKQNADGSTSFVNALTSTEVLTLDADDNVEVNNTLVTEGGTGVVGIAETYATAVERVGGFIRTTIFVDLTGLHSTAAGDIIGDDGTSNPCHIGQWKTTRNGTYVGGRIVCLETPAGGNADIDLYAANESTGTEDTAISTLTETQLIDAGAHAANAFKSLTAGPADGQYLYLVAGATTDADYTAGKLLIELYGV